MDASIGAALKKAREVRRLTLDQVSEATKVRRHYLEALENDDLSAMPSAAQARGFLRIYAQFIGVDVNALLPQATPEPEPLPPPVSPVASSAEAKRPSLFAQIRDRLAGRNEAEAKSSPEVKGDQKKPPDPASTAETESKKKASS